MAGYHDLAFERDPEVAAGLMRILAPGVTYRQDAGATVEGGGGRRLRVWASPWQPEFHRWAFNLPRGAALAAVWARVPADTQVLVTHTPPFGILDRVLRGSGPHRTPHVGCEDLRRRVAERPALRLHVIAPV